MSPYSTKTAWHQRFGPVRWLRGSLRKVLFYFIRKTLETNDGKAIVAETLNGLLQRAPGLSVVNSSRIPPYTGLGSAPEVSLPAPRNGTIIISARFRSGSTLLWNLFRHLEGFTSYYEPFNERRWFDPSNRGSKMDATHRNVSDYWKEYDGLSTLGDHFREEWIRRNLFMDSTAWDPAMKRYVEILIDEAPGRSALQFNRIDFRLPWFRRQFPGAKIVHLYRHPRDQWCSSLMDVKCFPKDGNMRDFARHDYFYLLMWAEDLKYHFPFLDEKRVTHPYELFYYIWKLSYLFGRTYSHYSLAFEDLVSDSEGQLRELFEALDIKVDSLATLKTLIASPPLGKWKEYAEDKWFQGHESKCESVLAEWLRGLGAPERESMAPSSPGRQEEQLQNGVCVSSEPR
jgi:hypothetical protein